GAAFTAAELLAPVAEAFEVLRRKVDTATACILGEITQNVRQLESYPCRFGVLPGLLACKAPDVNARQPNDRGHTITVKIEIVKGVIRGDIKVHRHPIEGGVEIVVRDAVGGDGVGKGGMQRMAGRAFQGAVEAAAPVGEGMSFLVLGAGG